MASTKIARRNTVGSTASMGASLLLVRLGGLQVRMDDGAVTGDDGGLQDLVLEVGGEGALLRREQGRESHQVAGVERAGVGGDPAGQVGVAEDLGAVGGQDRFVQLGALDIAALLDG